MCAIYSTAVPLTKPESQALPYLSEEVQFLSLPGQGSVLSENPPATRGVAISPFETQVGKSCEILQNFITGSCPELGVAKGPVAKARETQPRFIHVTDACLRECCSNYLTKVGS